MTTRWEPSWKPRASDSTWHSAWRVPVSKATQLLDPEYDGTSLHAAVRARPVRLNRAALPEDFTLGVVFGPSGSGKSSLLQDLADHFGLEPPSPDGFEFGPRMAVCSRIGEDAVDLLSCVGLNRVPSWLKPARVLSNGEQQRVLCALSLKSDAVLDDFAAVVDEQNAASLAASLSRFIKTRHLKRVLVSTTKRCVLPFLAPDFVLFTTSGVIAANPWPRSERAPKIDITCDIEGFVGGAGGGWQGPARDTNEQQLAVRALGHWSPCIGGTSENVLEVEVDIDDACWKAADAFDYTFTGRTEQAIYVVDADKLHDATHGIWSVGAMVGPSGTGKSCNVRRITGAVGIEKLSWDDRSVIDQLHPDPLQARSLAEAVALPKSAALRPWRVLSSGEQDRAEWARRLGAHRGGGPVCLDEFTSGLDRTTAREVCRGVAKYVRESKLGMKVVVATVHEDILGWLMPDWILSSKSGVLSLLDEPESAEELATSNVGRARALGRSLSAANGESAEELKELLKPPCLSFHLSRVSGCRESVAVYNNIFKEHHYLNGKAPTSLYGLVLRDQKHQPVAFHGISYQVGVGMTNMSLRESRLVVLPDFQGFGLGPRLSNCVGALLARSHAELYAKTAHPRLGAYRDAHPELWCPNASNGKISSGRTMGGSLRRRRERSKKAGFAVFAQRSRMRGAALADDGDTGIALEPTATFQASQTPTLSSSQTSEEGYPPLTMLATPLVEFCKAFCTACTREERMAAGESAGRGRPPRHTCGRPPATVLGAPFKDSAPEPMAEDAESAGAAERPRKCFSHKYAGPAMEAKVSSPGSKKAEAPTIDAASLLREEQGAIPSSSKALPEGEETSYTASQPSQADTLGQVSLLPSQATEEPASEASQELLEAEASLQDEASQESLEVEALPELCEVEEESPAAFQPSQADTSDRVSALPSPTAELPADDEVVLPREEDAACLASSQELPEDEGSSSAASQPSQADSPDEVSAPPSLMAEMLVDDEVVLQREEHAASLASSQELPEDKSSSSSALQPSSQADSLDEVIYISESTIEADSCDAAETLQLSGQDGRRRRGQQGDEKAPKISYKRLHSHGRGDRKAQKQRYRRRYGRGRGNTQAKEVRRQARGRASGQPEDIPLPWCAWFGEGVGEEKVVSPAGEMTADEPGSTITEREVPTSSGLEAHPALLATLLPDLEAAQPSQADSSAPATSQTADDAVDAADQVKGALSPTRHELSELATPTRKRARTLDAWLQSSLKTRKESRVEDLTLDSDDKP